MLRVRTQLTGVQGAPWLSTMFFSHSPEDSSAAQAAANGVGAFWNTVKAYMSSSVSYATQPTVDVIADNGSHTGAFNTTQSTGTGSSGVMQLPQASQGLCQWRTGVFVNNREVRGRTFIPGLTTAAAANSGMPIAAFVTAVQGAQATLIALAGATLVVWDRKHVGHSSVISGTVAPTFAVLRSRRD